MSRCGKHRRAIYVPLVLGWLLVLATPAQSNVRLFLAVQRVCASFRVPVTLDKMSLEDMDTDNATFHILLNSRRNNFEEVMLYGYVAVNQALSSSDFDIRFINVVVTIPKADNLILMTTADIALVEQLGAGEIKSSEFMRKIQWN